MQTMLSKQHKVLFLQFVQPLICGLIIGLQLQWVYLLVVWCAFLPLVVCSSHVFGSYSQHPDFGVRSTRHIPLFIC